MMKQGFTFIAVPEITQKVKKRKPIIANNQKSECLLMNNEMDKVLSQLWFNIQNWVSLPIPDQLGINSTYTVQAIQSIDIVTRSDFNLLNITQNISSFGQTTILTDLGKVGRLIQNDKNLYHSQRRNAQRNQFKPVEYT